MTLISSTDFSTLAMQTGKGCEDGFLEITNSEFLTAVFPALPEGAFAVRCKQETKHLRSRSSSLVRSLRGYARPAVKVNSKK